MVCVWLVGLVDKLIVALVEVMLLIRYIREKQWANQDKSRITLEVQLVLSRRDGNRCEVKSNSSGFPSKVE